ncbi:YihY/virulence factor BrkB family protein [Streptomyces beijiangensis]|uniref:YihY/virulence factor BrkB family protein n=1 Tax=Streptomyces beijiangensis TaxID=163361 RepID=A0A939F9F3_9ACTN|nr:YhjD/YihY/BrkB family envelope integrity protein [Streptomyces beijiangensis]MBO0512910.1 YihY/virulence factor BrkB family protein [Streptomyces beijiangensis]
MSASSSPIQAITALWNRMPFVGRVASQLTAVNIFDCATRLAAQAFLSAIPVLFVIGAFAPQAVRDQLVNSLRSVMGLGGATLDQVQGVLTADSGQIKDTSGSVGVLVTLMSATACSRALQRVCERSWHLRAAGLRLVMWRWVVWLVVLLAALIAQGALHDGFGVGVWLGLPLSLVASVLLWWWTQHLLLGARLPWLPLLPGALITGIAVVALSWGSRLYVPHTLQRSVDQFGPLGAVFTLLSWLIVFFACITVGIAFGYVVAHEQPFDRWLRTSEATGRTEKRL